MIRAASRRIACAATALAFTAAPLALAVGPGAAPARADDAVVDRTPSDEALSEDSGIAFSTRHPGVLWSINDSGNPPVLFAIGEDGATRARLRVSGVPNVDWEAVAAFTGPGGRPLLAVADIGDNAARRKTVEIDVVPEPDALRSATVSPLARLVLTYPDGAHDAETLLVDAKRQRMFVVTKGLSSTVYAVPASVWPGSGAGGGQRSGTLQPLGSIPLFFATDGAILPDGHALVRTYTSLVLLPPPAAGDVRVLASADLPTQKQGEGLAVDAADTSIRLSSEGKQQPILRLALPQPIRDAVGGNGSGSSAGPTPAPQSEPTLQPGTTSQPGPSQQAVPAPEPLQQARPAESPPVWNLLAGVAVLVGLTVALRTYVRRH